MARDDEDEWALNQQLGGATTPEAGNRGTTDPTSNTMPVTPPPAAPPAQTTPPPAAPPITNTMGVQPSVYTGYTPKHAMEGFAFDREQNTGKSAKDAFAYLSNQAPPPPINDKAKLGEWFNQYIKPGMDQLGHKVNSVNGDSFNFSNWQGTFDVDYGRGAGAEGGALAWQVNDPTAKMSNAAYTPRAAAPVIPAASTMPDGQMPAGAQTAAPNSQAAMDKIRAEIEAIINGRGSPIDNDALLQQLQ
jgi:hypothetical protein